MSERINEDLLAAAKAFVAWADDCWGSWAISEATPKAKAEYEAAKLAIANAERISAAGGAQA